MGNKIASIVTYFIRSKFVFTFCLLLIAVFIGIGISRLRINEDFFAVLPKGKDLSLFSRLIESKSISNQVVFSLKVSQADEDAIDPLLEEFQLRASEASPNYLGSVVTRRPDAEQHVLTYLHTNFPSLIDSGYYSYIDTRLSQDSINEAISQAYKNLTSPGSPFIRDFVLGDPLSISAPYFKSLNRTVNPRNIKVEDGIVFTADKSKILVTASTLFNSRDAKNNIKLHDDLEAFATTWNAAHPQNAVDYFGTFEIAAANSIQVKKDTRLTLWVTIILLLVILLVYFRKPLMPLYFMLPVLFGGAFALGVLGFLRHEVSAIALGTSAVLLGIVLDYAFHFFTHALHTGSVIQTIKEISKPLIVGSITTVTALAALFFANSPILKDFGLFAAFSLLGAALFTLIGLPVFIELTKFKLTTKSKSRIEIRIPKIPSKLRLPALILVIGLTVFFLFHSQHIRFDSDLTHLGYHPENLREKEQELAGIDPATERRIYVFATSTNYEDAREINFKLYEHLQKLQSDSLVSSFVSAGQFAIPEKVKAERTARWNSYWGTKRNALNAEMSAALSKTDLSQNAFTSFNSWIDSNYGSEASGGDLLKLTNLSSMIDSSDGKVTFISTVVMRNENAARVRASIVDVPGAEIFDVKETAGSLLETVKNDFNFILWISASIVFLTLLVIYGRIELTLLTFFPMVISWIWILGIAALLDIPFNFVNVVVSTFIFGLGDDFSIFMTDGLLQKYRYKSNNLSSYSSGMVLSALSTIVGTGVLLFAVHPAIHSVAAISVIGIVVILIMSLFIQPILFDYFIQSRVDRGRPPLTLLEFGMSLINLTYFVVGCTIFYPILVTVIVLPLRRKFKVRQLNRLISLFSWTVIYFGLHVRTRVFNRELLNLKEKPAIIIANHSSFLDIMLMLLLSPRIIIMVKKWVHKSILFGFCVRYAGYIFSETEPEENLDIIRQRLNDGYSVMIFPEGSRSKDGIIKRFHKGAFLLAQELQVDIIPILIHGASYCSPKGTFIIRRGDLNMKILPRIRPDDLTWGSTYRERTKSIQAYFRAQYLEFKDERETRLFMWRKVFNNYLFKGVVVEWYGRIKWALEFKNYREYDILLKDCKSILDVGCGYGYLDFFLHYKNPERRIHAIDYDDEKVRLAEASYGKTDTLHFSHGNIISHEYEQSDAIMFNDILHYISEVDQLTVLNKAVEALNPKGILLVRDGIHDLDEQHHATKFSEKLSTTIFGFNKKESEFHFFSHDFIKTFAANNNLSYEMVRHSKTTSNVLFILRKQ